MHIKAILRSFHVLLAAACLMTPAKAAIYLDEDFEGQTAFTDHASPPLTWPVMDRVDPPSVGLQGINLRCQSTAAAYDWGSDGGTGDQAGDNFQDVVIHTTGAISSERSFSGSHSFKLTAGQSLAPQPNSFPWPRDDWFRFWQFAVSVDPATAALPAGTLVATYQIQWSTNGLTSEAEAPEVTLELSFRANGSGVEIKVENDGTLLGTLTGAAASWHVISIISCGSLEADPPILWQAYDPITDSYRGPQPADPSLHPSEVADPVQHYPGIPAGVHIFFDSNAAATHLSPAELGSGWGNPASGPERLCAETGWRFYVTNGALFLDEMYWQAQWFMDANSGGDQEGAARCIPFDPEPGFGTLRVNIEPPEAIADGARWSHDDGSTWHESGEELTLPEGRHVFVFNTLPDWETPPDTAVSIIEDSSVVRTGTYHALGSIRVDIAQGTESSTPARWRLNDENAWHESGVTVPHRVGEYVVIFQPIEGHVTPAEQNIEITHRHLSQTYAYYNAIPIISAIGINPAVPGTLDDIQAVVQVVDPDHHGVAEIDYSWVRGGESISTDEVLSDEFTQKDEFWDLFARVRDGYGDWSKWAYHSFHIANTPPSQPLVEVRPQTPNPDEDIVVEILEYSTDPDGDPVAYFFTWLRSRDFGQTWSHRVELDGLPQVSSGFINEGDLWRVEVLPYERDPYPFEKSGEVQPKADGAVTGSPGWYQVYVGENTLPAIEFTELSGARDENGAVRLHVGWSWLDADGDACEVLLYWTDRGGRGLNPIGDAMPAGQEGFESTVAIPQGGPTYIHAIIMDAKGAMSQITSQPIDITEYTSAAAEWLMVD